MSATFLLMSFAFLADDAKAAPRIDGLIAMKKVELAEPLRVKGGDVVLELLAGCHFAHNQLNSLLNEEKYREEYAEASKGPHLRIVFARPPVVKANVDGKKTTLAVDELFLVSPRANGPSHLWVRCGKQAYFASRYEGEKAKQFIAWLKEANLLAE